MKIIDVHAHLDFDDYKNDLDKVLEESKKAGVVAIVNNGVTVEGNKRILELSKKYPLIKPAFGIYPTHIEKMSDAEIKKELEWIKKNKPVAIGEVGLDYKEGKDFEKQKKWFREFADLGKELDIPLIVHSRKAELDVVDILEKSGCSKIVMHCFSGRFHLVERIIKNGWFFSIPCIVTKLNHFKAIVEKADISKLLTETDAPYLSPFIGVRNEPKYIAESLKEIARIKKMDVDEVSNNIFMNYQNLFL